MSDSSHARRSHPPPPSLGRNALNTLSLSDALVLLPAETWTCEHRQAWQRDVLGPVNGRRKSAGLEPLTDEAWLDLLSQIQLALAKALDACRDAAFRAGTGELPRTAGGKQRRRELGKVTKAAAAIEQLHFDDQDRLARLTYQERAHDDPDRILPATVTHLGSIAAQAVELRALARAAESLRTALKREPPAPPRNSIRAALVLELMEIFTRVTQTPATRVLDPNRRVTGHLARYVRALLPPALHDPKVGLDRLIRTATQGYRRPKRDRPVQIRT